MTRRGLLTTVAALATAVAASGCGVSLQSLPQIGGTSGGYQVHAVFDNVASLAPNAEVREGDAVIGRVSSIKARDYQAVITMQINKGLSLPVDTTAEARFNTPLGDEYVALSTPPRSGGLPALAPGATIGEDQTRAAPTVADTLAALATVLYGSGLSQAETVVREVNDVLGGRGPEIKKLLSDVNTTVSSLAANDTHIDGALTSVAKISGQLNSGSGALVAALTTLPAAAQTLSADNTAINRLLAGVNQLTPSVLSVIHHSGANLITDSQQLAPVAGQLAKIQGQVGSDLVDVNRLLRDVGRFSPAGYAQVVAEITGLFPPQLCTPHVLAGLNPTYCNPLASSDPNLPGANYVPAEGLSSGPASPPLTPTGSASGALSQMEASLP